MAYAKRADANQVEIVQAFRQAGCSVAVTHRMGQGFPDVVIGVFGVNLLVEIKSNAKTSQRANLTPCERFFHDSWKGKIEIVSSLDEVEPILNKIRR